MPPARREHRPGRTPRTVRADLDCCRGPGPGRERATLRWAPAARWASRGLFRRLPGHPGARRAEGSGPPSAARLLRAGACRGLARPPPNRSHRAQRGGEPRERLSGGKKRSGLSPSLAAPELGINASPAKQIRHLPSVQEDYTGLLTSPARQMLAPKVPIISRVLEIRHNPSPAPPGSLQGRGGPARRGPRRAALSPKRPLSRWGEKGVKSRTRRKVQPSPLTS